MRSLVVEVVGAWGAGKTTLVTAIADGDRSIQLAPCVWHLPSTTLLRRGLPALATAARLFGAGRRAWWKEARQLVRLRALYHEVQTWRGQGHRVVLLDEGPVVLLSWLRPVAQHTASNGCPAAWWSGVLTQWARTVDLVVFLDAPNSVLAQRIRTRTQRHPLKDRPEAELAQVIERHRAAYLDVLADLRACRGPTVLSFRTDRHSIADIGREVRVAFDRGLRAP